VTDNTTGQSSTTEQWYDGPGNSAEWITESLSDENNCAGQCTMTGYDPAVTYNGLNYNAGANPNGGTGRNRRPGLWPGVHAVCGGDFAKPDVKRLQYELHRLLGQGSGPANPRDRPSYFKA
jgi:hypothetical protein